MYPHATLTVDQVTRSSMIHMRYITAAINKYEQLSYDQLAVPMVIPKDQATMFVDEYRRSRQLTHKISAPLIEDNAPEMAYVGSAEQSLIHLYARRGNFDNRKVMALTPCVRAEPICDQSHFEVFLKLELAMWGNNVTAADHFKMVLDAKAAMEYVLTKADAGERIVHNNLELKIIRDPNADHECVDLMMCSIRQPEIQIEVGSYGIRTIDGVRGPYVYGTGIAEPRFGWAVNHILNRM